MSELPEIDDATFKLATGEELVMPGLDDSVTTDPRGALSPVPGDEMPATLAPPPAGMRPGVSRPTWRDRRTAGRLRARKVRRLVRHVEPWSVLKISLIFYFCLWVIMLIAGVILWRLAVSSGTIDNVETFITELFALESFAFNPDQIFRASAIGGLVMVVAGSGFTVLMAVLFNLISDVTGGMRFTVVEEETARPRPKRIRPRRGLVARATGAPATGGQPIAALAPELPAEFDGPLLGEGTFAGDSPPLLPTADSAEAESAEVASTQPDR